jgi:Tol biopolymer transport system component
MTRPTTLLTLTRAESRDWAIAQPFAIHLSRRQTGFSALRLRFLKARLGPRFRAFGRFLGLGLLILGLSLSAACSRAVAVQPESSGIPMPLNSRYTDEQPALSGNGQFVAFVSNRKGDRGILLYDLKRQQFVDLPRLNRWDAVAERPSISNTARYIVYVASGSGRPEVELYDRVTHQAQVLTSGYRGWVRNPSISPDGRYVAFELGRDSQWNIQILDRGPSIELDLLDESAPMSQHQ